MTTPPPIYTYSASTSGARPPEAADHAERSTYRRAAFAARTLYPGAVGELVSRELLTIDEFAYRFVAGSLLARLRDQIADEWRKYEEAQRRKREEAQRP